MEMNLLFAGSRSASVLLEDGGYYAPAGKWQLWLNEKQLADAATAVVPLFCLLPDTDYTLTAQCGEERQALTFHTLEETMTLDVRRFGALGDGVHDDTAAIQAAILCCPEKGRVRVPAGTWLTGPLFLKSHIRLEVQAGAELRLTTDRSRFPVLPGLVEHTDELHETSFGSWEGNPLNAYAALLTAVHVEDVIVYGQGILNGQASHDNWWKNAKGIREVFRPRMVFWNSCHDMVLQGLTIRNSPAWNLQPYFSQRLKFLNLCVEAPANSPNTDGFDPESCSDVLLAGTRFSLGDDCIALKSGKIYMGARYKTPSERMEISHCLMENGHGGVTLGSEMAGGIRDIRVFSCLMRHTDRGLRVKTRRGRGRQGVIDGITFEHVRMEAVRVPLAVNARYFCDPDGHAPYVQTRVPQPVDERTPAIGTVTFRDVEAEEVTCAGWAEGLAERPIACLRMERVHMVCAADAAPITPIMADEVPQLTSSGLHVHFARRVELKDVSITGQEGPDVSCEQVEEVCRD